MKKIFSLLLALALLLPAMASTEIDLSALSFADLVALRQQISQELITRPEWKEVTVPQGVWKVGEDIPAGHWTIIPISGGYCSISISDAINQMGTDIGSSYSEYYFSDFIESPDYSYFIEGNSKPSIDIELFDGLYIVVKGCSCVFSPYIGKPSLGF